MVNKKISIFGWILLLLLLYLLTKNKTGYSIVYNSLFIILIFVLITSYKEINSLVYTDKEVLGG